MGKGQCNDTEKSDKAGLVSLYYWGNPDAFWYGQHGVFLDWYSYDIFLRCAPSALLQMPSLRKASGKKLWRLLPQLWKAY